MTFLGIGLLLLSAFARDAHATGGCDLLLTEKATDASAWISTEVSLDGQFAAEALPFSVNGEWFIVSVHHNPQSYVSVHEFIITPDGAIGKGRSEHLDTVLLWYFHKVLQRYVLVYSLPPTSMGTKGGIGRDVEYHIGRVKMKPHAQDERFITFEYHYFEKVSESDLDLVPVKKLLFFDFTDGERSILKQVIELN